MKIYQRKREREREREKVRGDSPTPFCNQPLIVHMYERWSIIAAVVAASLPPPKNADPRSKHTYVHTLRNMYHAVPYPDFSKNYRSESPFSPSSKKENGDITTNGIVSHTAHSVKTLALYYVQLKRRDKGKLEAARFSLHPCMTTWQGKRGVRQIPIKPKKSRTIARKTRRSRRRMMMMILSSFHFISFQ